MDLRWRRRPADPFSRPSLENFLPRTDVPDSLPSSKRSQSSLALLRPFVAASSTAPPLEHASPGVRRPTLKRHMLFFYFLAFGALPFQQPHPSKYSQQAQLLPRYHLCPRIHHLSGKRAIIHVIFLRFYQPRPSRSIIPLLRVVTKPQPTRKTILNTYCFVPPNISVSTISRQQR